MVVTDLTVKTLPTKWQITGVEIEAADWKAIDTTDGARFTLTGDEILLLRNDNVGAAVVTINSVADPFGRSGDATINMAAGDYWLHGSPYPRQGWQDGNGYLTLDADVADVKAVVLKIRR